MKYFALSIVFFGLSFSLLILEACSVPNPKPQKEWNNRYDAEKWKAQYEVCKSLIDTEPWIECMKDFDKDE